MKLIDKAEIAGTKVRADGALLVDARVARTGIQLYAGYEVGKPEMPVVRVFRPADEVFSQDTLASFAHRPVTNDHPADLVTADTWRKSNPVGTTSDEVAAQDIYVRVPLMISDGDMIQAIADGKRELSAGYTCDLDFTAGKTQNGEAYDAVQRNIRVNHIAVVQSGRAGPNVKIGDTEQRTMKTMLIDSIPVQVDDQGEAIIRRHIDKLAADLATATQALTARDERIGTLTADLAAANARVPDQTKIAQLVADRVALETHVKAVAPNVQIAPTMTDADIRRTVVKAMLPDLVNDQTSDAEVTGMFKTLKPSDSDTYRDAARGGNGTPPSNLNDNGQGQYETYLANAWQMKAGA